MLCALVVDDDPRIVRTIRRAAPHDFALLTAGSYAAALSLLDRQGFCAALVDLNLERPAAGLALLEAIVSRWPARLAALLTASDEPLTANRAFRIGVPVLRKPASREDLHCFFERARRAARSACSPDIRARLDAYRFSERQRSIVEAALLGLSNEAVGARLALSRKTVETYVTEILAITGNKRLRDFVARLREP